jgi:transcriptional regulator with XRE-family HTH domain
MVAKHFGISFQAVQKYEAGHSRIVASTLYRLCELLGVPPAYFFEGYAPEQAGVRLKRKGKP